MKHLYGFTLIELLVVIFIMSIVSSVALLSISFNTNRKLDSFANEFVQRLSLAEEQAILQPAVLGLVIDTYSYQFVVYQPAEGSKKATWNLVEDKVLNKQAIPSDIELNLEVDGRLSSESKSESNESDQDKKTLKPSVIISTNGDITPFTLYIGRTGKKPRYVIRGEADGNVTSKLLQ